MLPLVERTPNFILATTSARRIEIFTKLVKLNLRLKIANQKTKIESYRHAELLVWIANAPRFGKQDKKPWTINDFLPETEQVEKEMTAEEIERLWWNEAI